MTNSSSQKTKKFLFIGGRLGGQFKDVPVHVVTCEACFKDDMNVYETIEMLDPKKESVKREVYSKRTFSIKSFATEKVFTWEFFALKSRETNELLRELDDNILDTYSKLLGPRN